MKLGNIKMGILRIRCGIVTLWLFRNTRSSRCHFFATLWQHCCHMWNSRVVEEGQCCNEVATGRIPRDAELQRCCILVATRVLRACRVLATMSHLRHSSSSSRPPGSSVLFFPRSRTAVRRRCAARRGYRDAAWHGTCVGKKCAKKTSYAELHFKSLRKSFKNFKCPDNATTALADTNYRPAGGTRLDRLDVATNARRGKPGFQALGNVLSDSLNVNAFAFNFLNI